MLREILTPEQAEILAEERRRMSDLQVALARMDAEAAEQAALSASIAQLDELFLLVVVGEFNSGKSALINALLGKSILEEGVTPTTRLIQVLRHGDGGRVPESASLEVITDPAPLLRQINIVDTPGTNAIQREHEALTRDFVPRSDLVLFVTSADRPFTESERSFLENIREWGKKIVVVVNKIDLLEKEEEAREVLEFVRQHARTLLGFQPEIFALSARHHLQRKKESRATVQPAGPVDGKPFPALLADQFVRLEEYIENTLDEASRIRLKFLNPLGVGWNLCSRYAQLTAERIELLRDDLRVLDELDDQFEVFRKDMEAEFDRRLSGLGQELTKMEGRGTEFFDDRLRLTRVFDLVNRARLEQDYQRTVVADLPERIETGVSSLIDWLISAELRQWENVSEQIEIRRKERPHLARGLGRFDYDRTRLIETVGAQARRTLHQYAPATEAGRVATELQAAVAGTALVEVGAIGLGAAVSLLATSTLVDVTGLLAAGALATLGLFVIPQRRRRCKEELRLKIETMRRRLMSGARDQFNKESSRILSKLTDALSPYTLFVRGQNSRLQTQKEELQTIRQELEKLRLRIDRI